ncbi:hypothetical protein OROGR_014999 [Orobanche gracilis]
MNLFDKHIHIEEDNEGQIGITSFFAFNTLSESATKDVYGGDAKESIDQTNDSEQIAAKNADVEISQENTKTNEPGEDSEMNSIVVLPKA